jgi:hypothetical protein
LEEARKNDGSNTKHTAQFGRTAVQAEKCMEKDEKDGLHNFSRNGLRDTVHH